MELCFDSTAYAAVLAALHGQVATKFTVGAVALRSGSSTSGLPAVLKQIAQSSPSVFLPAADQEVDDWLSAVANNDNAVVFKALENALAVATYLVGHSLSVADVAAFAFVKKNTLPTGAVNTARWYAMCEDLLPVAEADKTFAAAANAPAAPEAPKVQEEKKDAKKPANVPADAKKTKAEGADKGKAAGGDKGGKGGATTGGMPPLKNAVMGEVVTRFPPEPSGYLHIGHVKAVLLNDYYARAYNGKLILRFDDTNPSKEKDEFEQNIITDLASLGVKPDVVTHTSEYFDLIADYARQMIRDGVAFMDDTPQEQMRAERESRTDSKYRDADVATNMTRFEELLKGSEEGLRWCLRAKIDMKSNNGTMRDPVLYRGNLTPHHRTGTKYRAYPTYDLACPVVDSHEGVTHSLRSNEYHDRDEQFYWLLKAMRLRPVIIQDFSRLNFIYTLLSKRKLTWFVENKYVDGWSDARFPTVQGMLRRGLVVPALREFILGQGASKRILDMEWDKFWATNRKHIDPIAPRYTALNKNGLVPVTLSNGPATPELLTQPLHPKNADVGVKAIHLSSRIFLEQEDVALMKDGEEITLMKWGNCIIRTIHKDAAGKATSIDAELHLEGDFKKTEKKVTWLPDLPGETVAAIASEFDFLIKVPKLEEGGDFQGSINPVTRLDSALVGEPALRNVQAGDIIQLERKGFYRVDRPYLAEDRPAILFAIPDGKAKGPQNFAERGAK